MPFGDAPSFVRTDLFGGTGQVTVWDLLRGATVAPFAAVLGCELKPGGSVGRHQQQHYPEVVIGLVGQGEAEVGSGEVTTTHRLCPGDVVFLPHGAVLALRNLSAIDPLRYLIVKATA